MISLSLDPSFLAYGWSVIEDDRLMACGCIAIPKRTEALLSDYDTRVLGVIATELREIIKKYNPDLVITEHGVGSKSSRANQTLGYVKGLTIGICVALDIKYTTIRARTVKKELTGLNDATKDAVNLKVCQEFPNFTSLTKGWTKVNLYAASDAAAVYLGHKKTTEVKKI